MTNGEKYKTAQERAKAFGEWCEMRGCGEICDVDYCDMKVESEAECTFAWLERDAEEEKILPCPFCGGHCGSFTFKEKKKGDLVSKGYSIIDCTCGYSTKRYGTIKEAIIAHNRVVRT